MMNLIMWSERCTKTIDSIEKCQLIDSLDKEQ